jgi:gas vesicle protein
LGVEKMAKDSESRDIRFALGYIVGIATGLALGFIFAPRQGEDTRYMIREKIADTGERVKEIAADVSGAVQEIASDVSGTVQEVVGDRKKIYKKAWKQPKIKPYNKEF